MMKTLKGFDSAERISEIFFLILEFIYFFLIFIFKLYIIVLVLPNIKMNPPQVYMFDLPSHKELHRAT